MQKYKQNIFKKLSTKNSQLLPGITSLTILLLEKNYKVYHITMEPELQVYTKLFWPEINVKSLSKNVFEYSIKKQRIFHFRKKNNLNQYFGLC